MTDRLLIEEQYVKNAAGVYVKTAPISATLVAAASTGQAVTKKSDGTLELTTISGGSGSAPVTPDSLPASADPDDDEFDTGSSIDTVLWTAVNATNLTNSVSRGALLLDITTAAVQQRGYVQALTGDAAWTYQVKVGIEGVAGTSSFEAGLWLRENGTGKLLSFHVGYSGGPLFWTARWTDPGTFGATINTFTPPITPVGHYWYLRVSKSGSNYLCDYSRLGRFWTTLSTVALTTPFTTAADEIGVKLYNDNAANVATGVFEHFRRTA